MRWIYRELITVGRLLFEEGLVSARSGNLSRAFGDRMFITRTGSNMGFLSSYDILELPLRETTILDTRASVELPVHREVILRTGKSSVVHAHPTYTLRLAYETEKIAPLDSEGKEILGEVPVLSLEKPSASEELAREVSSALKSLPAVAIRGHGVFCAHKELMRAYSYVSTLEHSCKLILTGGQGLSSDKIMK